MEDITDFPYEEGYDASIGGEEAVDAGQVFKDDSVSDEDGVVIGIMDAFGINYTDETDQTATFYIKELVNWFLVILGIISLIVLLW